MRRKLSLLVLIGIFWTGALRAEMWCGPGPSTPLDHPCGAVSERAASTAATKYSSEWLNLSTVRRVEPTTKKNGGEEIWVYVDEYFSRSERSKIPDCVEGIPVVIFPDYSPITFTYFGSLSNSAGSGARNQSITPEQEAAEKTLEKKRQAAQNASEKKRMAIAKAYTDAVNKYRKRWLALPGVLGIGPSKCDDTSCDFGSVGIAVQRQFVDATRSKIPRFVDGVPTVLIPQD
ncbi:MAG TPA: hypothetical protein VNF27_14300 [Candidatus Binataceae bacterium]|nr:hypothetical protein [Candidatus Binataceae bacterium]